MRGYVGVTDGDWYRFLAAWPDVSEAPVKFWRPGGGNAFRALEVGEPFFFKTHAPHNRVVGGGFFSGFAPLRASEAWELLHEGNGVASLEQMRELLEAGATLVQGYTAFIYQGPSWARAVHRGLAATKERT